MALLDLNKKTASTDAIYSYVYLQAPAGDALLPQCHLGVWGHVAPGPLLIPKTNLIN